MKEKGIKFWQAWSLAFFPFFLLLHLKLEKLLPSTLNLKRYKMLFVVYASPRQHPMYFLKEENCWSYKPVTGISCCMAWKSIVRSGYRTLNLNHLEKKALLWNFGSLIFLFIYLTETEVLKSHKEKDRLRFLDSTPLMSS